MPTGESRHEQARPVEAEMSNLDEKIRVCKLCRLHEGRTHAVPGSGRIKGLEIMFVGEGPGRSEDMQGEPFVGAGGKLLDSLLEQAGLNRSEVYITNIVKCRPPDNRKPLDDEIETCTSAYLEDQIRLLRPKIICTLGATALEYFTGEKSMGAAHGKLVRRKDGKVIFPTYHPAAVFRNQSLKAVLGEDIKKIPSMLKEIKKEQASRQADLTQFLSS